MDSVKNAENNVEPIEIFNNDTCDLVADRADAESYEAPEFLSNFGDDAASELLTAIGVVFDENQDDLTALLDEKFDPKNAEHVAAAKDVIEKVIWDDIDLIDIDVDDQYELMAAALENRGLLDATDEKYLCFGSNMGWRQRSGYTMQEINDVHDIVGMLHGNYDYTAHVYEHPGQPYLTAKVSSHDAPTGEFYTIIPESWMAEAIKRPEVADKIRDAMRDDIDIRDVASQYLPEMQGDNMALAGIKYAIIDEVDRLGNPKNILEEMKCIAANLAVLDRKEFEVAVRDAVANGDVAESNVLEYLYGDETTPFYKDFQEEAAAFSYQLPEKPFDKSLANGILKVMQTKNEDKIGKMVDGLFGENREKEIKSLKKLGKEMAVGR